MKLKTSNLISGFKEKTYEILVDQLEERGTIFEKKFIHCTLSSKLENGLIELSGSIKVKPNYECVRCLDIYSKSLNLPIQLTLYHNSHNQIKNNRLDIVHIKKEQNYLDLNNIIADIIELAKPMKPLCKPNCKGLCPMCGINKKNTCSCNFQRNRTDWGALKNLTK